MRSSIVWSIVFAPGLSGSAGFSETKTFRSAGAGPGQRRRNAPGFGPDQRSGRPNPPFAAGARPCSVFPLLFSSDLALFAGSGLCLTVIRERQVLLAGSKLDAFLRPLPDGAANAPIGAYIEGRPAGMAGQM
jgi:hypothetical protein